MTEDLGRAELELSTDQSKLNQGIDAAEARTRSFLDRTKASFRTASGELLKGIGLGIGQSLFGLAQQGLAAVTGFVEGSIAAASDLRESMSLSAQVFEDNTDAVARWAAGAARSFGQSQREALNFAANFGTAFKNVGFSLDETAAKAQTMTRLAADLGSAFNASSEEAAVALRSGLLGESEPLRRFGVFLDEAKVKAKALAMGMEPVNGAFTDGQKVLARYQLIMEQTADSQGMFGRDTESLADAQKSLAAELENLQAEVGRDLMPVLRDLTKWMRDDGIPTLKTFVQVLRDASGAAGALADWLSGAAFRRFMGVPELNDVLTAAEEAKASLEESVTGMSDVVGGAHGQMAAAAKRFAAPLPSEIDNAGRKAVKTAKRTGREIAAAIADGLEDDRTEVERAIDKMVDAIENGLTPAEEKARLLRIGRQIRDELQSEIPEVRARAQEVQAIVTARLAEMEEQAGLTGHATGMKLAGGLQFSQSQVDSAADALSFAVKDALGTLPSSAYGWGYSVGRETADGLEDSVPKVKQAAEQIAAAVRNRLRVASPAKEGPLSEAGGPGAWAERGGGLYAGGWVRRLRDVIAAVSAVAGSVGSLSALTAAPSLVPSFAGAAAGGSSFAPAVDAAGAAGGGSHYHLHVQSQEPVRDVYGGLEEMRRFGDAGVLPGSGGSR